MATNWIAGAKLKKGAFSAKAKAAGSSTAAFAAKKSAAPGKLGKEARLTQTFAKIRPKAKKKPKGMAGQIMSQMSDKDGDNC